MWQIGSPRPSTAKPRPGVICWRRRDQSLPQRYSDRSLSQAVLAADGIWLKQQRINSCLMSTFLRKEALAPSFTHDGPFPVESNCSDVPRPYAPRQNDSKYRVGFTVGRQVCKNGPHSPGTTRTNADLSCVGRCFPRHDSPFNPDRRCSNRDDRGETQHRAGRARRDRLVPALTSAKAGTFRSDHDKARCRLGFVGKEPKAMHPAAPTRGKSNRASNCSLPDQIVAHLARWRLSCPAQFRPLKRSPVPGTHLLSAQPRKTQSRGCTNDE